METWNKYNAFFSKKDNNKWCGLYPLTKLVIAVSMSLLSIFSPHWIFGYAVFLTCLIIAIIARQFKPFWKIMRAIILLFVILVIIARVIFHGSGPIFYTLGPVNFYGDGVIQGLSMSSVILAFSSALVLFTITTKMEDLMISLEDLGLSQEATFIFISTFQLIPDLSNRAKTINDSQKSRGIEVEGNIFTRMKALFPMLVPLILSSMTDAEEKSLALETRGFNTDNKKEHIKLLFDTQSQKLFRKTLIILTMILAIVGGYLKWLA